MANAFGGRPLDRGLRWRRAVARGAVRGRRRSRSDVGASERSGRPKGASGRVDRFRARARPFEPGGRSAGPGRPDRGPPSPWGRATVRGARPSGGGRRTCVGPLGVGKGAVSSPARSVGGETRSARLPSEGRGSERTVLDPGPWNGRKGHERGGGSRPVDAAGVPGPGGVVGRGDRPPWDGTGARGEGRRAGRAGAMSWPQRRSPGAVPPSLVRFGRSDRRGLRLFATVGALRDPRASRPATGGDGGRLVAPQAARRVDRLARDEVVGPLPARAVSGAGGHGSARGPRRGGSSGFAGPTTRARAPAASGGAGTVPLACRHG